MSTAATILLLLLSVIALVTGLIILIFKRGRRKRSLYWIGGALGAFVAAMAVAPNLTPEQVAERAAQAAAARQAELDAVTLADYIAMKTAERAALVAEMVSAQSVSDSPTADLVRCLGSLAREKAPDLSLPTVLGWCVEESRAAPARFKARYNELDAPDLATEAWLMCKGRVTDELRSPSTADFPFLDYTTLSKGELRYLVQSYVDAQNGFGATIRTHFICDLQFTGPPEDSTAHLDRRQWTIFSVDYQ